MRQIVLRVFLRCGLLLLVGCGFQLRGQVQLPPEFSVVYVKTQQPTGSPPGAVSRKLRLLLANNNVTLTTDPAQAKAIITILREDDGRRVMATDRYSIKREYFLAYAAVYQVTLADGRLLIPPEGIDASRTLLFDENEVLGFENAQESLIDNMADDLAWQILRRLQTVGS